MSDLQLSILMITFSNHMMSSDISSLERRVDMLEAEDPDKHQMLKDRHEKLEKVKKYSNVFFGALIAVQLYLRYRSK